MDEALIEKDLNKLLDLKLCYGCMEPIGEENICPHCGYDRNATSLAKNLKPGTMLHNRFAVGKALCSNGEGITYVGYDTSVGCKVLVREYMPEQLCSRVPNSAEINVSYAHLAQYKALMAEYTELNKALARLRNLSHLNPALDLFAENNTTYAVYEYLEGRTLLDYLKENAGELSWNTVRRIFPPLFTTLSLLHNAGVLHRGISPETIFVTDKGELKLRGFCISAVRTADTELDAELYDGYAAPEQYRADTQQGTWTDVYGICAVLYRILTGCRATDAVSRQDYDNLVPPAELNSKVPENVSQGIMQGLALEAGSRVRSITDLVTLLFENAPEQPAEKTAAPEDAASPAGGKKSDTAVYDPALIHNTAQRRIAEAAQTGSTQSLPDIPAGFATGRSIPRPQQNVQRQNGQRPAQNGQRPNGQRPPQNGQRQNGQRPNGQRPTHNGQRPPQGAHRPNGQRPNPQRPNPQRTNGQRPNGRAAAQVQEPSLYERVRAPLFIAFLFTAIAVLVVFAFIKLVGMTAQPPDIAENTRTNSSADNIIPAETTTTDALHNAYIMPNLIGRNFQIKRDEVASWLVLEPVWEFSDTYLRDQIIWQDLEEGEAFAGGSTVKVGVSLGIPHLAIPSFTNMRLQEYLDSLTDLGFVKPLDGGSDSNVNSALTTKVNGGNNNTTTPTTASNEVVVTTNENGKLQCVVYKARIDWNYNNGFVCAVDPAPGTVVDCTEDYTITVYYAYNPVFTTISGGTTMSGMATTKNTTTSKGTTTSAAATTASKATTKSTETTRATVTTTSTKETEAPTTQKTTRTDPPTTAPTEPPTTQPQTKTEPPATTKETEAPPPPTTEDAGGEEAGRWSFWRYWSMIFSGEAIAR